MITFGAVGKYLRLCPTQIRVKKMRHSIIIAITIASTILLFASCKKEETGKSGATNTIIPLEQLYGKWYSTHYLTESGWTEIGHATFTATFYPDGSYSGSGILGSGSGTYIVSGSTITTYINGEEFYKYDILEFTNTTAHLKMYRGTTQAEIANSTKEIKVAKEQSSIDEVAEDGVTF